MVLTLRAAAAASPAESRWADWGACHNRPDALRFEFCRDSGGWASGFADLPVGELNGSLFDLEFRRERVPSRGERVVGLKLAGSNRSDDLFMFLKRQITGLRPNGRYRIELSFTLFTNAGRGCVGIGGAPGESVFVKAGASTVEPRAVARDGALVMNIDKGNQGAPGTNAIVVGDLASGAANCEGTVFAAKRFRAELGARSADEDGNIWLLLGTDSGYEGRTDIYVTRIEAELKRR
jgi:hypothetical protein